MGFLIVGCSQKGSENRQPTPSPVEFDSVVLRRTACFGQCPVYTVEISATGQVKYIGEEFVGVKGIRHGSIPQANVELLAAALRHVKFAQMNEKYQFETDGCINMPTDPSVAVDFAHQIRQDTQRAFLHGVPRADGTNRRAGMVGKYD